MRKQLLKFALGAAFTFCVVPFAGVTAKAEDVQAVVEEVTEAENGVVEEATTEMITEDTTGETLEETTDTTEADTADTTEIVTEEATETDETVIGEGFTGWQKEIDYTGATLWRYYRNDKVLTNGPHLIDGKFYFFDDQHYMLTDSIRVGDDGYVYQIAANGQATKKTVADGWFNNEYYIVDGKAFDGWKKVGDYWYRFSVPKGKLCGFWTIYPDQYYFDDAGRLKIGWFNVNGGWYWSNSDGIIVKDGWHTIGGSEYYFNSDGVMQSGICQIDGFYYNLGTDGKLAGTIDVVSDWYSLGGKWYYFDSKGELFRGPKSINGTWYYFDLSTGAMRKNLSSDDRYYGSNGKAVTNTWVEINLNQWRYYGADGLPVTGWKKISNKWYYFTDDYYMQMVTGDKEIDGIVYHFGTDGVWDGKSGAKANGWYKVNGNWRYRVDGKDVVGLIDIGSDTYFFDYEGNMMRGTVVGVNDERYVVQNSGKVKQTNGWYAFNDYDYTYVRNGRAVDGLQTIGGKQYYFSYGYLNYGSTLSEDAKTFYEIDNATGVVKKVYTAAGTKWVKISNGDYLYSENGRFAEGIRTISGKTYAFDYSGTMMTNYHYWNGMYFGSTGAAKATYGWVKSAGEWKYLVNGNSYYGPIVIDGTHYKFTFWGALSEGMTYREGNYYYYSFDGGRTKMNFKEGWNKYNNKWYYMKDGSLVQGNIKIGGVWYRFGTDYAMVTNAVTTYYYFDEGTGGESLYIYLDANGKMVKNAWKQDEYGTWYYFGADGICVTGEQTIGGKKYIFGTYGNWIK